MSSRSRKTKRVSNNLLRLARRLFPIVEEQRSFVAALENPAEYPVGLAWTSEMASPFHSRDAPEWLPDFSQLVSFEQRPGRHLLHEKGHYYCLDPSSIFMMLGVLEIQKALSDVPEVLDVCASPGGKSVLASLILKPSLLVANEVIGKRLGALVSNFRRCQLPNTQVTSVDTSRFSELVPNAAEFVLVDAPCSGQSLIAKGKESPGCFHPATINLNANRQRRILANSACAVRPGGWLVYMTCTYSLKENESNVKWFLKHHPDFEAVDFPGLTEFRSPLSPSPCFRLWPWSNVGAGGFFAVFHRSAVPADWGSLRRLPTKWNSPNE